MSSRKSADKAAKKLIQACLPFKLMNSPGEDANSKCRKRKLSGTENDETRVENPKVELLNGGTKCFIKSDEDDVDDPQKLNEDVDVKMDMNESNETVVLLPENITEKTNEKIKSVEISNVDEDVGDDCVSVSSDSDNAQNDTSVNSNSDSGNTTPRSKNHPNRIVKKQESAKKQEERLRLKLEKEKAREEKLKEQAERLRLKEQKRVAEIEAKRLRDLEKEREKKQKEEERKAKELEKEKERKQKEEERKAKELEKEKERKQKEEEKKAKELEKERKEEERKAKELEKEKLKEEKLLREETEKKKNEKVKAAFVGFFKPKSLNLDVSKKDEEIIELEQETYFMPFQAKQDMKIAPFCRTYLNSDKKKTLENNICQFEQNEDLLYLNLLKTGIHKPSKSEKTWPVHVEDDADVIIIETCSTNNEEESIKTTGTIQRNNCQKNRWKFLQFKENKRPPYWGTWRKKSLYVKPRRPFACDKIMFDYDIDSDDEWEEEDPGESIHGTDNEEEPEDDYEVDNDVFVPHGYLSDEEGQDHDDNISEENQKEKLKLLGEEFEAEIKKKTERIKPRLVGCIWIPNTITNCDNVSKSVADTLLKYRCIWDGEEPIITDAPNIADSPKGLTASESKKTSLLPDTMIPDLITFIHGYSNGIKLAAKNFFDKLVENDQNVCDNQLISLAAIRKTIKTIATKSSYVAPWSVSEENFEKYGIECPKSIDIEVSKPTKSSVKKITSFLTHQNQKGTTTLAEKSATEMDENIEPEKREIVPKNLFNVQNSPKRSIKEVVKEEQKVRVVDGKKRITPVLLSPPKKNLKCYSTDRKPREKSRSPEVEIVDEGTSVSKV